MRPDQALLGAAKSTAAVLPRNCRRAGAEARIHHRGGIDKPEHTCIDSQVSLHLAPAAEAVHASMCIAVHGEPPLPLLTPYMYLKCGGNAGSVRELNVQ